MDYEDRSQSHLGLQASIIGEITDSRCQLLHFLFKKVSPCGSTTGFGLKPIHEMKSLNPGGPRSPVQVPDSFRLVPPKRAEVGAGCTALRLSEFAYPTATPPREGQQPEGDAASDFGAEGLGLLLWKIFFIPESLS